MNKKLFSAGRYILHAFLASYGIMFLGFFVEMLFPARRKVDYFFIGPTFLFPVVAGLFLGVLFGGRLSAPLSRCLFLLPLAIMLWDFWTFLNFNNDVTWRNFFHTYLGTNCTSSECLSEVLVTSPFLSSLSYALGAEIGRLRHVFSWKRTPSEG